MCPYFGSWIDQAVKLVHNNYNQNVLSNHNCDQDSSTSVLLGAAGREVTGVERKNIDESVAVPQKYCDYF
jgi:hypothetical protein